MLAEEEGHLRQMEAALHHRRKEAAAAFKRMSYPGDSQPHPSGSGE